MHNDLKLSFHSTTFCQLATYFSALQSLRFFLVGQDHPCDRQNHHGDGGPFHGLGPVAEILVAGAEDGVVHARQVDLVAAQVLGPRGAPQPEV